MFDACYDGRAKVLPYRTMQKYVPSLLGVNNTVLVEVRVAQWKCHADGKMAFKGEWDRYRVGLELGAVTLLFVGPDAPPPDLLADDDDEFAF